MKCDRKEEIIRKVIYANMKFLPCDTMDTKTAFETGRAWGIMEKTLREELEKEVDKND